MKKLVSLLTVIVMLAGTLASCSTPAEQTASSASETEQFLIDRLGSADGFVLGTADKAESMGIDMTDFRDEGYIIRAVDGDTVILGKTEDGLDRGVRYFANHLADEDNVNYTSGEGYRVKGIEIAGRDISEYSIYLFEDADECHTIAANELQKYVELACGVKLDIVREPAEHMIVLERVGEDDPRAEVLGREGFNISVKENGDLYISGGRDRGCLYGVYELLESYIGWRFAATARCSTTT